jgi:hypothetical protein
MWILKPDHLFAGRGIELASRYEEIQAFLDQVAREGLTTKEGSKVAAGAEWVVQKYVERPLLLCAAGGDRKFDVRVNVLVTDSWDVYVYRDAFCRTSSLPYSLPGEPTPAAAAGAGAGGSGAAAGGVSSAGGHSKTVHVTNNCYQVECDSFGRHEEGNILSMGQLQAYLDAAYGPGFVSVQGDLFPRWIELILDVLSAARMHCVAGAPADRRWFDMLGFDFLVDAHFRSWLIEANTNPSIDFHCKYTDGLYARLLEETVRLTVDQHFVPRTPPHAMPSAAFDAADTTELPWAAAVRRLPRPVWARGASASAGTEATGRTTEPPPSFDPVDASAPVEHRYMNRWQLVWSETRDLAGIPHQAAMAPHALNREAVDEVRAAEARARSAGTAADSATAGVVIAPVAAALRAARADAGTTAALSDEAAAVVAQRHGFAPLLQGVAGVTGESSALAKPIAPAPAASSAAANSPASAITPFWRPVLRRYIRRRDAEWLYPVGMPAEAEAPLRAGGAIR